jgi:membrane-associated phospholipid phosphatase
VTVHPDDDARPPSRRAPAPLRPVGALVTVGSALAVLALLGAGVVTDFGRQMRLDGAVSETLYAGDGRARPLDWLLEALTAPGVWWFRATLLLGALIWLGFTRAWRPVLWVVPAVLGIGPLTELLKELFGRVRPDFAEGGARYESLSYPSGHSSGIATLVTVALVLAWPVLGPRARRWCVAVGGALVLVVGLTRMWLGVHYLSDVLGGWSLGLAWSLAVALVLGGLPGGRSALRPREREPAVPR